VAAFGVCTGCVLCGVCTGCRAACCSAPSTHTTQYTPSTHSKHTTQYTPSTHTTCCHNTALLITMYLYWLFPQKCNVSQAQCTLLEDGPKHVRVNIRYFNVNFNILYGQQKVHLLVKKRNFNSKAVCRESCKNIGDHMQTWFSQEYIYHSW
jgi:hypothetical protein